MALNKLLGLGDCVDRLAIVNIKMSLLEGIVKDSTKSDEEAGRCARVIRKLNQERNTLRNILNKWSGTGFEEIKVEDLGLLEGKNGR
jgi:hypothetical protein